MAEYILLFLSVITVTLIITCWVMKQNLKAIEEQVKRSSDTLQLEIHAIRDALEEAMQKQHRE